MNLELMLSQIVGDMLFFVGVVAALIMLPFLDRLRVMNFRTHRASVVTMHLCWAMWLGWVAYQGMVQSAGMEWYQVFGMIAAIAWLMTSQPTWRTGPPEHTTSPAPLDDHPADKFAATRPH